MVEVERFDVSKVPDHGRPEVARFTGRTGSVAVHCSREDGSLWLFAKGPRGGERARVTVPVRLAGDVLAWQERHVEGSPMPCTGAGRLAIKGELPAAYIRGEREILYLPLGEAGAAEFATCLREWAEAALRVAGG